jgi:hypothetical protein
MRRQQMRDRQPVPFDCVVQRREWRAGVDKDGRSTLLVCDEIGVGKPDRVHASLDEHRR